MKRRNISDEDVSDVIVFFYSFLKSEDLEKMKPSLGPIPKALPFRRGLTWWQGRFYIMKAWGLNISTLRGMAIKNIAIAKD